MKAKNRNYGCRIIDDSTYKGYRNLTIENEVIRVSILLDKGADVYEFRHKPTDTDFLWRSPNGLRKKEETAVNFQTPDTAFLDNYHGGWQDVFPGGGPMDFYGATVGLHGEINQLPWDYNILIDREDEVKIEMSVNCLRVPFVVKKTLQIKSGEPKLYMVEEVTNLSSQDLEIMWGTHPAFGTPFLEEGCQIHLKADACEVHKPDFMESGVFKKTKEFIWPNIVSDNGEKVDLSVVKSDKAGYGDMVYIKELKEGWYAIINKRKKIGFGLSWPLEMFPFLWFWLVYGKSAGYPWWDRAYCIALEPWSSWPNNYNVAKDAGRLIRIKGNETISVPLTAVAIDNTDHVNEICINGDIF